MRRSVPALLGAALVLASPGTAAAQTAQMPPLDAERPVHLALGDSVTAGHGSAPTTGDHLRTVARWQRHGYAARLHKELEVTRDCPLLPAASGECPDLQYVNIARSAIPAGVPGLEPAPGVTTTSLIAEQLPAATALLRGRNTDADPDNDVELVTMSVGGNDVFGPVLAACVTGGTPESPGCASAVRTSLTTFATNYTQIVGALRTAAGPGTAIVTTAYYNPLPSCVLGQSPANAAPLAELVLEGGTVAGQQVTGLNEIVREVSAQAGAVVADLHGELGPAQLVGGTDCLHPNHRGHREIADVAAEALREARG